MSGGALSARFGCYAVHQEEYSIPNMRSRYLAPTIIAAISQIFAITLSWLRSFNFRMWKENKIVPTTNPSTKKIATSPRKSRLK